MDVSAGFFVVVRDERLWVIVEGQFLVCGVIDWFENKMDFNSVILQNFSKFAV